MEIRRKAWRVKLLHDLRIVVFPVELKIRLLADRKPGIDGVVKGNMKYGLHPEQQ